MQAFNVFSGSEPVQITSKPIVTPIKTRADSSLHVTSSPTHDIVDDLLGAVVHSHLTKDSLPRSSPLQNSLSAGQVKFDMMQDLLS